MRHLWRLFDFGIGGLIMDTILIIEDDEEIAHLLNMYLERHDFHVLTTDGWDALSLLENNKVNLILLDIMLPGEDGFELCRELRKRTDIPIMFMSAKSEDSDKILGLTVGGDDYVTKPFSPSEVVARVKAQLRRYKGMTGKNQRKSLIKLADMEIDEERFVVRLPYRTITLSAKEFQILVLMAQNPDHIYKPEELFQYIWNSPSLGDARTVMVHISNLRKKIELDPTCPKYIVTIRGVGYKFMGEGAV